MSITDPTANPPPAVLAYLNERLRRDNSGAAYFADDAGRPHIDITLPGCPNADARAVALWTRTAKPDLWQEAATVETKFETAAPSAVPTTAANLMGEVRSGRMTASEVAASLLSAHGAKPTATRPGPAAPDTPTYADSSMTSLMAKVRAGDRSALTALTALYLDPAR